MRTVTGMHFAKGSASKLGLTIVVTGGKGDALLITPFVRHFRKTGKYSRIGCAVTSESYDIFETNPHLDLVIPCTGRDILFWALPEKESDVFVPYMEVRPPVRFRPGMRLLASPLLRANQGQGNILEQIAQYHGIKLNDMQLDIFPDSQDEEWAKTFLAKIGERPAVFFNPLSRLPEKNLPRYVAEDLARKLLRDFTVIEAPFGEPPFVGTITLDPPPTIRRSAALFRRLHCVISVDSFPGHLAAATGTPAVVLFGPSRPEVFGHEGHMTLRPSVCPPCADTIRLRRCTHHNCMKEYSPDQIFKAVKNAVGKKTHPNIIPLGAEPNF